MDDHKYLARALVVDDDPAICEILSDKLSREGYECVTRSGGTEAVALLRREAFDVILSDLRMPGISGMDFLERARQVCPRAAFLLVTGEQDVRIGIEAMKRGASDYVVKPFQADAVLRSVAGAIEKRRLETEVENYRQHLEEMVEERTRQVRRALRQIEKTYDETLEALGAAVDLRDAATAGHCTRVTRYALEIAKVMGCEADYLRNIARGAYLHDIGKIGIPDGVLLKDGALSREEQALMRTHVEIGDRLVSRIAFLEPAMEIVRYHHERFDGAGYPNGLRGESIPLGARIFAVADALDAMTSDRPYRNALPWATAEAEIQKQSGSQFDPEVVDAFLSVPHAVWQKIQADSLQGFNPGLSRDPEQLLAIITTRADTR
ncbi:MAG TPA: HD domain-containing phosphohydrolase [Terriglobia bacterium]|nr:HD domain-containing phosphohydrolase [Terriglobia bacterium]